MLHARKHQLVLETTTTATEHYSPNTSTILKPRLDVIERRYVQDIPNNIGGRNEAKKAMQIHLIIMTDADYGYILDKLWAVKIYSLNGM